MAFSPVVHASFDNRRYSEQLVEIHWPDTLEPKIRLHSNLYNSLFDRVVPNFNETEMRGKVPGFMAAYYLEGIRSMFNDQQGFRLLHSAGYDRGDRANERFLTRSEFGILLFNGEEIANSSIDYNSRILVSAYERLIPFLEANRVDLNGYVEQTLIGLSTGRLRADQRPDMSVRKVSCNDLLTGNVDGQSPREVTGECLTVEGYLTVSEYEAQKEKQGQLMGSGDLIEGPVAGKTAKNKHNAERSKAPYIDVSLPGQEYMVIVLQDDGYAQLHKESGLEGMPKGTTLRVQIEECNSPPRVFARLKEIVR